MSEIPNVGSGAPGSPAQNAGPVGNSTGEPAKNESIDLSKYVPKDQFDQAQQLIGTQGNELGELRSLFKEVAPLLEKLEKSGDTDTIVEAIMSDKFDINLAKAVLEGKVKVEDATTVAQAHSEVKKDIGKEEYKSLSPQEIEKLVMAKASEIVESKMKNFDNKISKSEAKREFIDNTDEFLANTPDFPLYAEEIVKWINEHDDQYDIRIAYDVIKGRHLAGKMKEDNDKLTAEEAKRLAANAAGGYSQGGTVIQDKSVIDSLISEKSNPNVL